MNEHSLSTSRLVLEPLRESHADGIYESFVDERIWTYFPKLRPTDPQALRARFLRWSLGPPADTPEALAWENWVGFLQESHEAVGTFQATIMRDGRAHLAYSVFPRHWRRGYASEAMSAIVDHLFQNHDIDRVVSEMDPRNEASIALAKRLGLSLVASQTVDEPQTRTQGTLLRFERNRNVRGSERVSSRKGVDVSRVRDTL
jgi:RimJ/RimL family protein N-acetyltransferase